MMWKIVQLKKKQETKQTKNKLQHKVWSQMQRADFIIKPEDRMGFQPGKLEKHLMTNVKGRD